MKANKVLTPKLQAELLSILKNRFQKNTNRHVGLSWQAVETKLQSSPDKIWSIFQMEQTGGEPDVVEINEKSKEIVYIDCSPESPMGRRSLCYDQQALDSRKENKPKDSAIHMAESMGIELLLLEQYQALQKFGNFDTKTSSWLKTPEDIRALGGAIFGDRRYNTVFIYHNGADSYYASRGFRGILKI